MGKRAGTQPLLLRYRSKNNPRLKLAETACQESIFLADCLLNLMCSRLDWLCATCECHQSKDKCITFIREHGLKDRSQPGPKLFHCSGLHLQTCCGNRNQYLASIDRITLAHNKSTLLQTIDRAHQRRR